MTISKSRSRIIQWTMVLLMLLTSLAFSTTAMAVGAEIVSVTTDVSTNLESAIGASGKTPADIGELTITGPMTETDFSYLRTSLTGLSRLDLTLAELPADGDGGSLLPDNAFSGCRSLADISLPEVTTVGSRAFAYCTTLANMSLPDATTIGEYAFQGCTALVSISANKATRVGMYMFSGCGALTNANFPELTTIDQGAFSSCSALASISLPKATTIGDYVFSSSYTLTSVSLPAAITLGDGVFRSCQLLTSISLPKVATIGSAVFNGCIALNEIELPNVETMGFGALSGCPALTSIDLPKVTIIKGGTFSACSALKNFNLPAVTVAESGAFGGCTALTDICLPSVITVQNGAFNGCPALANIQLPKVVTIGESNFTSTLTDLSLGVNPPTMDNNTFISRNDQLVIHVPAGMGNAYESWLATHSNLGFDGGKVTLDVAILPPPPPAPPVYLPKVSGTNELSGIVGEMGAVTVEVMVVNAFFENAIPFTCTIGDRSVTANATTNGALTFSFTAKQLNQLAEGTYAIMVSAPATGYNLAVTATEVGTLTLELPPIPPVIYEPAISGDNRVTVLPNSQFALGFLAELTGTSPTQAIPLTLSVNGESSTQAQTGDGTIILVAAFSPSAVGEYPIMVSAAATEHTKELAETSIGKLKVLDVSKWMAGKLDGKLPAGAILSQANKNVSIGFLADGATLDATTNTLKMQCKRSLIAYVPYTGTGEVTGTLSQVRINPFQPKGMTQTVPSKLVLSVSGKVSSSTKIAKFDFSAQSMNLLEPGYYLFSVESKANGKYKGFDPVAVAMIQVLPGEADPAEWMMPKTLRVSLSQTYQLVTAIPTTGTLPKLTVSSGDKSVATITSAGVLTTHKAGTTTITVEDSTGRKLKCKVTVVANGFNRARPLMLKGKTGLYTSTKKLSYKGNALEVEVFLYNRTGKAIQGVDNLRFELYDRETLIYAVPVKALSFTTPLGNKRYKVLKLTITESMLAGVSDKVFDLGTKQYTAIVRGQSGTTAIVPITYGVPTITQPKAADAQSAGSVTLASSITAP